MNPDIPTTRRTVLTAAAAGAGTLALSACDSGSTQSIPPASMASPDGKPQQGAPLAKLADIPVGSAVSVTGPDGNPVIVAQPEPGKAAAFNAACTHKGCPVKPAGKQLTCPCHGSIFEAATGAVVEGPATSGLEAVTVHVQDGSVISGVA
jgi:Rieske Fe-S protein